MLSTSSGTYREPRRLHGVPGVVYVLQNSALKHGLLQIGLSRRTGWAKALELNRDRANKIPGSFECIFELRAQDGGAALEAILLQLQKYRCGKREQDFFEVDSEIAIEVIERLVHETELKFRERNRQDILMRDFLEKDQQLDSQEPKEPQIRESIFKKAYAWVTEAIN